MAHTTGGGSYAVLGQYSNEWWVVIRNAPLAKALAIVNQLKARGVPARIRKDA